MSVNLFFINFLYIGNNITFFKTSWRYSLSLIYENVDGWLYICVGYESLRLIVVNYLSNANDLFFFNFLSLLLILFFSRIFYDLPNKFSVGNDLGENVLNLSSDLFFKLSLISSKHKYLTDLDKLDLKLDWLGKDVNEVGFLFVKNDNSLFIYFCNR